MSHKVRHKGSLIISGVALFLCGALAAFLSFHALRPLVFPNSPVTIHDLEIISSSALCPEEKLEFHVDFSIQEPSIIQANISVLDAKTGLTIAGTEMTIPARPHPEPVELHEEISWTVPDLPPGSYERVTGLFVVGSRSEVRFLTIPFTVRSDCAPLPPTVPSTFSTCITTLYPWYGMI